MRIESQNQKSSKYPANIQSISEQVYHRIYRVPTKHETCRRKSLATNDWLAMITVSETEMTEITAITEIEEGRATCLRNLGRNYGKN